MTGPAAPPKPAPARQFLRCKTAIPIQNHPWPPSRARALFSPQTFFGHLESRHPSSPPSPSHRTSALEIFLFQTNPSSYSRLEIRSQNLFVGNQKDRERNLCAQLQTPPNYPSPSRKRKSLRSRNSEDSACEQTSSRTASKACDLARSRTYSLSLWSTQAPTHSTPSSWRDFAIFSTLPFFTLLRAPSSGSSAGATPDPPNLTSHPNLKRRSQTYVGKRQTLLRGSGS